MIRTNSVTLTGIPSAIAYRRKAKAGGSAIVIVRADSTQPGIATISKTSGEAIVSDNTPAELFPAEAFAEAIELTAGLPYRKQGKPAAPELVVEDSRGMLGISFDNSDMIIDELHKRAADEMRGNLNENLPALIISQSEIRMPLKELRDLFKRFIREARTLEDNSAVAQKANPYTTDDVLRAFGKLPKEQPETSGPETGTEADSEKSNTYQNGRKHGKYRCKASISPKRNI